ncbi:hypothetical protein PoB_004413700 [Plakobranchus ocellatus]|uniref:Uncharacterized protein n=1 Tax=Plakobranchus ocellatus TaxID=259542 RepID=A0AAV4BDV2_9GAST|nr:hypothetical protein PoB_004413700 [Plakobranchus ocellatus]
MLPKHLAISNRVLLIDCCEYRLIGFTLEAFKQTTTKVFTYTDPSPTARSIYTVIVPANITDPIDRIRISKSDASPILTLCEVLIFGASRALDWSNLWRTRSHRLERNNNKNSSSSSNNNNNTTTTTTTTPPPPPPPPPTTTTTTTASKTTAAFATTKQ